MTFAKNIIIHFIHGSINKPFSKKRKRLGGLFGGHIETQVDNYVYGFEYKKRPVHLFRRKNKKKFNSKITIKTILDWKSETKDDKITSIQIPLSDSHYNKFIKIYKNYYKKIPYDYAFFGMRCASSLYNILGEIEITPKSTRLQSILLAFSPRQLRRKMIRLAKEKDYSIIRQKGDGDRFWE